MVQAYRCSKRKAVSLVGLSRSYFYYVAHPRDDRAERSRMREIANARVRYGMWRIHTLLRREGSVINHKKTQRLYVEEGLVVRRRRGRKRAVGTRAPAPVIALPNQRWSLDFQL